MGDRKQVGAARRRWRFVAAAVGVWCSAAAFAAPESYGPVTKDETLWSVAKKLAPEVGAKTAQVAWAIYQANPAAFSGAPGRMQTGATLKIPDAATAKAVPAADAYARLTGKAPAIAVRDPVLAAAELQPISDGEPHQWLVLTGSDFAPGATLEFQHAADGTPLPPAQPQSVRAGRIEYAATFPTAPARWRVVVRNPGDRRSAPLEFDVGAALAKLNTAFAGSPEQAQLIERTAAEERYQLLAPLESRYAGDADFDYPLGVAALDTGRFSEAVFVLQRTVATRPDFAGARMELARAYYALGDNESARREFKKLSADNPPPDAKRAIGEYLSAIDRNAAGYEPQRGVFVELAAGYDSNANGAPEIRNFIGFTLDNRNQSTESPYYALGAGGALSRPLAPSFRAVGSGVVSYRANPDASFVDSQALRLSGGAEWRPGPWLVSLLPGGSYVMLDGEENHQSLGVDGLGAYTFGAGQVALNLRFAQTRYTDALEVQDVDTTLFGVSGQAGLGGLLVSAAATVGNEEATETGSPFGRDLLGFRVAVVARLLAGHTLTATTARLQSDYEASFFGQVREDRQSSATLQYDWQLAPAMGLTLGAHAGVITNESTVALYAYERIDAGLSLRKEFK
ncbi:MAG TPA: FimV/HubP family polar landmark protein [Verrucomicrobiae bacterium]|nr:FimV/HubP family polar landmark protein [Verrucomicrobiae bacterium]